MPQGQHESDPGAFGPNAWLVDDMYSLYLADPNSVSESWRDFFIDRAASFGGLRLLGAGRIGRSELPIEKREIALQSVADVPYSASMRSTGVSAQPPTERARTITTVRPIAAKLLEVNTSLINEHLSRHNAGKITFNHVIAYAVVQALAVNPAVNGCTQQRPQVGGGTGNSASSTRVNLGLEWENTGKSDIAADLIPTIAAADLLDFRVFVVAYEDLFRRFHSNRLTEKDVSSATVTLSHANSADPTQFASRLTPGQSATVGIGWVEWPVEFQGADHARLAELGMSKIVSVSLTYDELLIDCAQAAALLKRVGELLMGQDGFYQEIFRSMEVPYEPGRWQRDSNPVDSDLSLRLKQIHVQTLINMYRVRGHLMADLDPLGMATIRLHQELDPVHYGLSVWDLDREFLTDGLAGRDLLTLKEILALLRDAYCRTIGVEYMHIQDLQQKQWIQSQVEGVSNAVSADEQWRILQRLNSAESFERFLHARYVGQKRFGLEGGESAIVILGAVLDAAGESSITEAIVGMAHRGRLNVLANVVGKSYGEIFREFEGDLDPNSVQGSGDVKYHRGAWGNFLAACGRTIPVTLASNPSHLEAVDPVVEGMARARQDILGDRIGYPVLSILIHGDAAFAGQGVVAETLNLSQLQGYRTGGTIHLVINNQLGFTTEPEAARSSVYATDVAKMIQAPIFHVNGDDPEACARVGELAVAFRQTFHKDVVIDMLCYRRFGHNEGDEPSFTQPQMYSRIERKRSVRKAYTESLVNRGDLTLAEAEQALDSFSAMLQSALDQTRSSAAPRVSILPPPPVAADPSRSPSTGVSKCVLDEIAESIHQAPEGFTLHPKLSKQFSARAKAYDSGEVEWALAEALSFGSLLAEGIDIRLAGQDTRRGTFSQRHSVLVDYRTGKEWVPLDGSSLEEGTGQCHGRLPRNGPPSRFHVVDSSLSEYAALGFEYGYSVMRPDALVAWEAQFGDFGNGAQITIDEFIVSAGDKWGQHSGLVLLLPHGYEGQGPDHSSARLERFLALGAGDNLSVSIPSSAAQYFHLLRAQAKRDRRRPLVILTPKSLLRAKAARSSIKELIEGEFYHVLDDTDVDPASVASVVLCSGKIAYEAMAWRNDLRERGAKGADSAVVRVEQLYPWPKQQVGEVISKYTEAKEVVWLQEEPENMGAWFFAHSKLHHVLGPNVRLRAVTRAASGSPATGSSALHLLESQDLLQRTFEAR